MNVEVKLHHITLGQNYVYDDNVEIRREKHAAKKAVADALGFLNTIDFDECSTSHISNVVASDSLALTAEQVGKLALAGLSPLALDIPIQTVSVDVSEMMQNVADKGFATGGGDVYNNKCEVHMPGNMMLMFNETMLLENSCTDEMQEQLNRGWRIMAACPQPDQRRPDYILGRYNPEYDNQGGAKR
tara:strand:+ start:5446 stop:6006 length:561 start_codon:yes stop_codon:yes gene_type:complete